MPMFGKSSVSPDTFKTINKNMIDWISVAANALWIAGLALALASFSYASWQASVARDRLRNHITQPGVQRALNLAGALFCAGQAATSDMLFTAVLWAILSGLFLILLLFRPT
jgi:hypothetical protein